MEESTETEKKKSAAPVLLALTGASILGSLMFVAAYTGMIFGNDSAAPETAEGESAAAAQETQSIEFLPIEPLLVSLGAAADGRQLRFEGYLEIAPQHRAEIEQLMPRIMDVLNTYLRAVDYADVAEPSSLLRIRLQMLRRVQIVVGDGRVNDLLVSKFLLS